ncbi:integral membrane protein [Lactiplantibacillus plantarum]|nr:integral membrane protein [Lactiplantibacillus plantarum]
MTVVANMLRPIMGVWLIALCLMSLCVLLKSHHLYRVQVRQLLIYSAVVLGLMFTATNLDSWLYGFKVAPAQVETLYSLATGTDVKSHGTYSPALQATVSHELRVAPTLTQAYPRITRTMARTLQTNLKQIKPQLGSFVNEKMQGFIREDYGYDWSLYNLSHHPGLLNRHWFYLAPILITSATVYWQAMLVIALFSVLMGLGMLWHQHYLNHYLLMAALLLDGFTLSALPLEVQGRYHIILYLPILMLMTCGIAEAKLWRRQIKQS